MPAPPVGARIRRARKLLHLTQQQLAEKVGVSRNTVDSWENDRAYPKRYDVALEQVLGISLGDDAPPGPLDDLKPTDEWEAGILADRYLPDEDKRWLIENSRAARLAAVEARRAARREQSAGQAEGRSGPGTSAG